MGLEIHIIDVSEVYCRSIPRLHRTDTSVLPCRGCTNTSTTQRHISRQEKDYRRVIKTTMQGHLLITIPLDMVFLDVTVTSVDLSQKLPTLGRVIGAPN